MKPYSRDEALRLAAKIQKWRQNSAHSAADQLRAAAAEIDRLTAAADVLADLCGGVTGADDDDRISEIKVIFSEGPSMWLRDAMARAVDAYRASKAGT